MQKRTSLFNLAKFTYEQIRLCSSRSVLTGERSVNQVTLLGRVGATPVARGSAEHPVTIFQVATSRSYKVEHVDDDSSSSSSSNPKQQYEQRTEWHRVSVFRKGLREVAATILSKGDRVYLTGSIHYSTFKDANSGQTVYSTSIIADNLIKLNGKAGGSSVNQAGVGGDTEDETMEYRDVENLK